MITTITNASPINTTITYEGGQTVATTLNQSVAIATIVNVGLPGVAPELVQVNSDWNSTSGVSQILNKPSTFPPEAHTHTKAEVGLANVDNTSDLNKPISTATQTALNAKFNNPVGDTTQYIAGDGSLVAFPVAGQAGTLVRQVRNETGSTLTKGVIVYINGAGGNKPTVTKAIATSDATSAQTFGIVQADIPTNQNGYVVIQGDIDGIDTSLVAEGTQLYLSGSVAGEYTTIKPVAPLHLVYIGIVTRSHNTQGQIEVAIQNGYELDELHDVLITSKTDNQVLSYEQSTNLWKNKSIVTLLGYTPYNASNPSGYTSNTGTVTGLSVASANGFGGSVSNPSTTPQITLTTSLNGLIKGNGTGLVSAVAGTDYLAPTGSASGLTGLTSGQVTTALGYTPYNSTNPNGYTNNAGTVTTFTFNNLNGFTGSVNNAGTTPSLTLSLQTASGSQSGQLSSTDWNTFNGKQDALVSGTSIKTVNGNSLLGSGDLVIGGGGGSTSPGGADGEIQYNSAGSFAGAANVEISGGNLKLVSTDDPTSPAGGLLLYSKQVAGRHLPKIIGPSGIDTVLQVGLHGNSVFMVSPATGTSTPTVWGGTLTTAATLSSQQTIASANPWQATFRKRFTTPTTAGQTSGMRTAYAPWFRGSAAGFGGFFFRAQLGANLNLAGGQKFVGLCASTGALAGEPSALVNMIGMGWDSGDSTTGNWFLMRNDGSGVATKVDLGTGAARANTTHGYDLIMFCPQGAATEIFVRITNIHTNTVILDTSYNTDIPAVNTGLAFKCEVRNGAVAASDAIECAKVYIESDY